MNQPIMLRSILLIKYTPKFSQRISKNVKLCQKTMQEQTNGLLFSRGDKK